MEKLSNKNSVLKLLHELRDQHEFYFIDDHIKGKDYAACRLQLNNSVIEFREGKITPKKKGHFVAFWQRESNATTAPLSIDNNFEALILIVCTDDKSGVFFFTKTQLAKLHLISSTISKGKRGFRVYAPWEINLNKSARQTQKSHEPYFFYFGNEQSMAAFSLALGCLR